MAHLKPNAGVIPNDWTTLWTSYAR